MSKFKVGDIVRWDGSFQDYEITKVDEHYYLLKLVGSDEPMELIEPFHDWYSIESTDRHSRKLTKLELALR